MQSNPSPEPPPLKFKTKNCDTIERINTLVRNLEFKLDQLCNLNCTKESDRECFKCKEKNAKILKTKNANRESARKDQEQYNQPVESAANATSTATSINTSSAQSAEIVTIEGRPESAESGACAEIAADTDIVADSERAASESQETAALQSFNNILDKTSPALELKVTTDGFHNSLLRIEANAEHILREAKEELESRLRAGGVSKVQGLKGQDPKKTSGATGETQKQNNLKTDQLKTIENQSSNNKGSNNKNSEPINKKNNNNNTKNNNNSKNQKPNNNNNTSNNNNTKILSFKLIDPTKMNVISYVQPLTPTKKLISEPNQEKNADSVSLKTLSAIYRAKVIDAYRNRQIFTVFGNYNTIRRSLLKRGWLEKLPPSRHSKLQSLPEEVLLQHAKRGNEYEAVVISKIINHFPAFFVWQPKGQRDLYADVQPYRNRIRRTHMLDFSTKVGLIGCAEQQQWYLQDGVAGMLYPRFYRLGGNQEELAAFTDDFRITQCRSLLQYLIMNFERPSDIIDYENGAVPPSIIDFALARVRRQLDDWENVTALDVEATQIPDPDWSDFLTNSAKILNQHQKFKCTYRELTEFVKNSRLAMNRLQDKRPDFNWDGFKNLWILKPGYQSRGLGIIIRNNLEDILRWSSSHSNRRYIVQKYIEQPLLIYRTKFDIRQYMLVFIRESTVQIWLYKDCYLRFSSQEYSIDDLREVIHLTNNSVQKKYKNKVSRDARLPKNNMWSLDQFKAYLKTQTSQEIWESRVFPGFRENLIAVVMASLDETNLSENSFELYGCDFMLDEQYNPILIEINSTPDLSASTEVTAHICPLVMQDCIKVVVDLPRNARATTGQFKLVYEVNYKFKQDINSKDNLNINGKSVELCRRRPTTVAPLKVTRKFRKAEVVSRVRASSRESNKKVNSKKSKISLDASTAQSLKASTKEVLALRYTIPK